MSGKTEFDYLDIFKKLNEKGIRYVVVGGIAVNLYGIPRMTYDIDLMLDLGKENVRAFSNIMKSWGFKPKAPVDVMGLSDAGKRAQWMRDKNMKAFCLVNPNWAISEIDIIIDSPVDFEDALKHLNRIVVKGVSIPVISPDGLIKMKQASSRQQDETDIMYLRELKNEKNEKKRI